MEGGKQVKLEKNPRSREREVVSSNLGRTNTQGLKITEEKVLSL